MKNDSFIDSRRVLAALMVGVLCFSSFAQSDAGANYPSRPITLVVPYPAGGANDVLGRLVGQKLTEQLKQSVIVDNKPGAGTTIGTAIVAKAAPDGYTLVLGSLASHAISPNLYAKPGYDAVTDFAPIGLIGVAPMVLIVGSDSKYKDLKSIVEAAKKQPNILTYGSSGNGSPLHFGGELFKRAANVQITHVPYKGGTAHLLDLMAGRIDMIFDTTTSAVPQMKGGKVRALAVASNTRLADFPNVPTFAELGFASYEVNAWYALYAPAKTPAAVVSKLSTALTAALKSQDVIDKLNAAAVRPSPSTPQELANFTQTESSKYGKLVKDENIKID